MAGRRSSIEAPGPYDGRTHGDGFGHTIDGCAQQNFITYDVQTEFSPLFFVSDVVLCLKTVSEPVYLIELVVVTVVGGGELVENPEKPCRNAGVLVSTGTSCIAGFSVLSANTIPFPEKL